MAEPALGLAVVQDTVGGVTSNRIRGEQVAETGLRRGVVSSWGSGHTLSYARPIRSWQTMWGNNSRYSWACTIVVGEAGRAAVLSLLFTCDVAWVGMHIEFSCPLRPLVEAWLEVVFLARQKQRFCGEGTSDGMRISLSTYMVRGQARARQSYEWPPRGALGESWFTLSWPRGMCLMVVLGLSAF
jgi:hypothetical protein